MTVCILTSLFCCLFGTENIRKAKKEHRKIKATVIIHNIQTLNTNVKFQLHQLLMQQTPIFKFNNKFIIMDIIK